MEKELKREVDLDLIETVDKLTDWVNGEHLHLPTVEELFSQMSVAKYLLKWDSILGYWQIKVDR